MKITVNGMPHETDCATLDAVLAELGHAGARVATALNEVFVPAALRPAQALAAGDRLEILSPMQGG